jgi:hypothetical protein
MTVSLVVVLVVVVACCGLVWLLPRVQVESGAAGAPDPGREALGAPSD